jgi:hypothetical protein
MYIAYNINCNNIANLRNMGEYLYKINLNVRIELLTYNWKFGNGN